MRPRTAWTAVFAMLTVCALAERAPGQALPPPDPPPIEQDAPSGPADPPEGHLASGPPPSGQAAPPVAPPASAAPADQDRDAFPDSSTRRLTPAELASADDATLCLAEVEIYARHGWWPDVPFITEYFWKRAGYPPPSQKRPSLNAIEQANLDAIERTEVERQADGRTPPSPDPASVAAAPSFKARLLADRPRRRLRSCRANMRTIQGAVEMYNLDKNTRKVELTEALWAELLGGGYLQARPKDPGHGPGSESHYYLIDEAGKPPPDISVGCRVHGKLDDQGTN